MAGSGFDDELATEAGESPAGSSEGQEAPRTIHDGFFKRVFGKPENAASMLRAITPEAVAEQIDWDSLEADRGSLERDEFRQLHCDLLFKARWVTGDGLFLQLVAEHQSTVDRWMGLRGLLRVAGLWQRHHEQDPSSKHLPAVLVYVVYHGSSSWTAPRSVDELVHAPEEARLALRPYLPSFRFLLDDLHEVSHEGLAARDTGPFAKLSLVMLKLGRGEDALEELAHHARSLRALHGQEHGDTLLEILVRYLWRVNRTVDARNLAKTLKPILGPEAEPLMMTFAEKLEKRGFDRGKDEGKREGKKEGKKEGKREGKREGKKEGQRDLLLAMLRQRFEELPAEVEARVTQASVETLHRWGMRVLEARSLDEVFEDS